MFWPLKSIFEVSIVPVDSLISFKNIFSTLLQLKMASSTFEADNCNTNLKKIGEKKLELTTIEKFKSHLQASNVHNKTQNVSR